MSRWRDRIRISGGFWLLAAWFTLVNGWQLLAVILSAAALHELGHLLVLRLLGARVRELRVSVFGAELMTSAARLSYPGEIAAVLAGPAVNLLCALVLGGAHAWVAAGAHLSLCLFNLLPVPPLDGSRILGVILPARQYFSIMRYERYIYLAMILLVFTGALDGLLGTVYSWVFVLLDRMTWFIPV